MQRTDARERLETRAFPIPDHALARRWSALVAAAGVTIRLSIEQAGAEEVLIVSRGSERLFYLLRVGPGVVLIDRIGMWLPYPSLLDALLAIVPLRAADRRVLARDPGRSALARLWAALSGRAARPAAAPGRSPGCRAAPRRTGACRR